MFLGIDLGSSSIKLSLYEGDRKGVIASMSYPKEEMRISAPQEGWAEQDPELWWQYLNEAFHLLVKESQIDTRSIQSIGISYQMHGLVLVDEQLEVLRPSIIWCDSRAVSIGDHIQQELGESFCRHHLLNSPGNFTASKLAWVRSNEPDVFAKIHKILLPGDYIAMKLSGVCTTTDTGLSEGIFWDYEHERVSSELLEAMQIDEQLLPNRVPAIGSDLKVHKDIAYDWGLNEGVGISYRCGDQPNNAFSLNVLEPGEIAATAGTSGVIYAVTDQKMSDQKSRINTFVHVNNTSEDPRNGVLICVNGTGIMYSWLKRLLSVGTTLVGYEQMNALVEEIEPGSNGIHCMPFGNGAERVFENKLIGSHFLNLNFNQHTTAHILRSALEGIVYALNVGFELFKDLGGTPTTIRAGKANLFLSSEFRRIFVNVTGTRLELYDTDGAAGAARGAALGAGFYSNADEAFASLERIEVLEPDLEATRVYAKLYNQWLQALEQHTLIN